MQNKIKRSPLQCPRLSSVDSQPKKTGKGKVEERKREKAVEKEKRVDK